MECNVLSRRYNTTLSNTQYTYYISSPVRRPGNTKATHVPIVTWISVKNIEDNKINSKGSSYNYKNTVSRCQYKKFIFTEFVIICVWVGRWLGSCTFFSKIEIRHKQNMYYQSIYFLKSLNSSLVYDLKLDNGEDKVRFGRSDLSAILQNSLQRRLAAAWSLQILIRISKGFIEKYVVSDIDLPVK